MSRVPEPGGECTSAVGHVLTERAVEADSARSSDVTEAGEDHLLCLGMQSVCRPNVTRAGELREI
jgi:hypothetical protein